MKIYSALILASLLITSSLGYANKEVKGTAGKEKFSAIQLNMKAFAQMDVGQDLITLLRSREMDNFENSFRFDLSEDLDKITFYASSKSNFTGILEGHFNTPLFDEKMQKDTNSATSKYKSYPIYNQPIGIDTRLFLAVFQKDKTIVVGMTMDDVKHGLDLLLENKVATRLEIPEPVSLCWVSIDSQSFPEFMKNNFKEIKNISMRFDVKNKHLVGTVRVENKQAKNAAETTELLKITISLFFSNQYNKNSLDQFIKQLKFSTKKNISIIETTYSADRLLDLFAAGISTITQNRFTENLLTVEELSETLAMIHLKSEKITRYLDALIQKEKGSNSNKTNSISKKECDLILVLSNQIKPNASFFEKTAPLRLMLDQLDKKNDLASSLITSLTSNRLRKELMHTIKKGKPKTKKETGYMNLLGQTENEFMKIQFASMHFGDSIFDHELFPKKATDLETLLIMKKNNILLKKKISKTTSLVKQLREHFNNQN